MLILNICITLFQFSFLSLLYFVRLFFSIQMLSDFTVIYWHLPWHNKQFLMMYIFLPFVILILSFHLRFLTVFSFFISLSCTFLFVCFYFFNSILRSMMSLFSNYFWVVHRQQHDHLLYHSFSKLSYTIYFSIFSHFLPLLLHDALLLFSLVQSVAHRSVEPEVKDVVQRSISFACLSFYLSLMKTCW